jgi:hypothetical protein
VIQQPCAIDMQSIHDQSIDTLADQHQRTLAAAQQGRRLQFDLRLDRRIQCVERIP